MDATAFGVRYPEFSTVDPALVSAVLAEVALGLDPGTFGLRLDAAQGALTAHKLWESPAGVSLRGDSTDKEDSEYWRAYLQIRHECAFGFVVIC